jgi:threonine/homoserine/homoserine lactone efflux protein
VAEAIGQVLSLAVGVSLSPVPIIAVVLMLGTPAGRRNGPAFLVGWVVGLVVVGAIVLVVAGGAGASENDEPATWVDVLKLVLGALLVLMAARQWRGRPRGDEPAVFPKWMQTIDRFTVGRSIAMGVALSGINPKNLLLTVAAAASVAQAGVSTSDEVVAMAVFVAVGTIGPGIPVAIYFAMGGRAARLLNELKAWLGTHNAAIMAVLLLVIGTKLIGDGISGLG